MTPGYEKIPRAREIGVLVATDSHGATESLAEYDCSLQGNTLTLIQEAPSPELLFRSDGEAFRAALFESARRLAVELSFAGLLEVRFQVDVAGSAWVSSVRLGLVRQHTLVEMVTGLDLVALQFSIAAGEPLPKELQTLEPKGHAVGASIVAMDQTDAVVEKLAFAPAPQGRSRTEPSATTGAILPTDDAALIAKLTTYEPIRHRALLSMDRMLAEAQIAPFATNIDALRRVLGDYTFRAGQYDSQLGDKLEAAAGEA